MNEFNLENAEKAETRTKKLNMLETEHDATNIYGYVGTSFVTTAAITGGAVTIRYTKV